MYSLWSLKMNWKGTIISIYKYHVQNITIVTEKKIALCGSDVELQEWEGGWKMT